MNSISNRFLSTLAAAVILFAGSNVSAYADDDAAELAVVESSGRAARIRVSHPDGLKEVYWYNDSKTYEGNKTYQNCPKTPQEIAIGTNTDPHAHGHFVVVEPCNAGDTETWMVKLYDPTIWAGGSFQGFGDTIEDDDSSLALEIADINLDGWPDIVTVDKFQGVIIPTVMLGNGDGTFEEIVDAAAIRQDLESVQLQDLQLAKPLRVALDRRSGPTGTRVTITVTGAAAGEHLTVKISTGSYTVTADANGKAVIPEVMNQGDADANDIVHIDIEGDVGPPYKKGSATFQITRPTSLDSTLTLTPIRDLPR